ncbi:phage replication initiation protein [Clostridium sp. CF012]|uniref:phage replication initiation protein n=1 Tax=Clostridium sp. CF012 TaxID=2843319 RepID=UPI001C0B85B4|nr:phage replication initiation protein [Clostridium sp. CF012]MBU3145746.1 phage replication initiation protein [Clostridium sp. CF012]
MAQKRMFSLKIIDTDLFLEMPVSSQLLYFQLSMRADDDGFVSSPNKIIKMVNCSSDDLKILIAKNFIIPFESGVCVIIHWRIHNYIQNDRYQETLYEQEKAYLEEDNGAYKLMDTECIQDGYNLDTQVRLGKVRIDEVSKDKSIKKTFEIIITEFTENEELKKTIIEFMKMRKSIKKALTEKALELILKKLNGLTSLDNEKIQILNNSIMSSWQGVFPLKDEKSKTTSNNYGRNKNQFVENCPARDYDFKELEEKLLGEKEEVVEGKVGINIADYE